MRYPRIEIVKRKKYQGNMAMREFLRTGVFYAEEYEVQTMRPGRPMVSRGSMDRTSAISYSKRELQKLKGENYKTVVYDGRIVNF